MTNKIPKDYLADIVENTALPEETLAVVSALNGVTVVVLPDTVDGVEECIAAECRATARGAIYVIALVLDVRKYPVVTQSEKTYLKF